MFFKALGICLYIIFLNILFLLPLCMVNFSLSLCGGFTPRLCLYLSLL